MTLTSIELCAGAGGQALGIARAGFKHTALVELDHACCQTLRANRPHWIVHQKSLHDFDGRPYRGQVDLLAAGVPCPPFSVAGRRAGPSDDRDLFPQALRLVEEMRPNAVMFENVPGLMSPRFEDYRTSIDAQLTALGYLPRWRLLSASDFGVSQYRTRVILVALRRPYAAWFSWPQTAANMPPPVGECLRDLMAANGWRGAAAWSRRADDLAPAIVGGSRRHGGPDLGPSGTREAWARLGVEAKSVANESPGRSFVGNPRLTLRMVARLQGFPDTWQFLGGKTAAYRQIGNALPPQIAQAVAKSVRKALMASSTGDSATADRKRRSAA